MKKAHFEILDEKRMKMLRLFKHFKDRFYLAGGTGLALQLGHRDSVDFDLFTDDEFNSEELLREVKQVFIDYSIEVVQAGNMTLNLIFEKEVKTSFFCIKDKLIKPLLDLEYFRVASIDDIACMKMGALLRAEYKDYVDLYYIFKQKSLKEVIDGCKAKYRDFNEMVYLKALTSFEDIHFSEILFQKSKRVKPGDVKRDFEKKVKEYLKSGG